MIVKVQASLSTNLPEQQYLIYDEARSIKLEGAMTQALAERLKGRPKVYFEAILMGVNKSLVLGDETEEQKW